MSRPKDNSTDWKKLRGPEMAAYRLRLRLKDLAENDPELAAIAEEECDLWRKLYQLQDRRRLADAQRRDGGAILWTVFVPEKYNVLRITRTLHRQIRQVIYHWKRGVNEPLAETQEVAEPGTADAQFRRAMDGGTT